MADKKFDPEKFNTDPAFENERTIFDQMFEGSFKRYMEKNKPAPEEHSNFFDQIFGGSKGGEK